MPVDVVFFHGAGEGAYEEDARLADSLSAHLGSGYSVAFPRLPEEDTAGDELWLGVIAEAIRKASPPVVLVGHSAGGYLLLKHLTAEPEAERVTAGSAVAAVCLIAAPFPGGDQDWTFDGFDLPERFGDRLPPGAPVFLYGSEDDEVVPFAHRDLYAEAIPGSVRRTTSGGHQLGNDLSAVAGDILALRLDSSTPG